MIDFTLGKELFNKFGGSELKTTILYDNTVYLVKYPDPVREQNNTLSYMNNQFSEYIGSHIFAECGFTTQETVLGYFNDMEGNQKIVVGCKDFTQNGATLHEFAKFCNQTLTKKTDVTIETVNKVIATNPLIVDKIGAINSFWDTFVIDVLIGNSDRHLNNWGFINVDGNLSFSPIYDCGSSLAALLADDRMAELLQNWTDFKNVEFNITSCYYMNGKRIFYHEIFKNPPHDLQNAIKRTVPKIDLSKIGNIIDETPKISDIRKEYLKSAVLLRYEQILLPSFRRLEKEKS